MATLMGRQWIIKRQKDRKIGILRTAHAKPYSQNTGVIAMFTFPAMGVRRGCDTLMKSASNLHFNKEENKEYFKGVNSIFCRKYRAQVTDKDKMNEIRKSIGPKKGRGVYFQHVETLMVCALKRDASKSSPTIVFKLSKFIEIFVRKTFFNPVYIWTENKISVPSSNEYLVVAPKFPSYPQPLDTHKIDVSGKHFLLRFEPFKVMLTILGFNFWNRECDTN